MIARLLAAILFGLTLAVSAGCGVITAEPEARPDSTASVDPDSGLTYIDQDRLPPEALEVIDLIEAGGPFPYSEDGGVFGNREGLLPDAERGYYREYTVETPGEDDRGARRIVTGDDDRILYYTDDHYQSFSRIRR